MRVTLALDPTDAVFVVWAKTSDGRQIPWWVTTSSDEANGALSDAKKDRAFSEPSLGLYLRVPDRGIVATHDGEKPKT